MTDEQINERLIALATRIERLERAVETMAWWLVQAQTGFGERD